VKRLTEQSLYEILEVPTDAAPPEIESAYTRARDLFAPGSLATYSLMAPEEAAILAERIEEAKRVLLDPELRARYDAALAAAASARDAAARIASTGSGAVAAGPQRPFLVPPLARTPPPPRIVEPPPAEPPAAEPPATAAQAEEPGKAAEPAPAAPEAATPPAAAVEAAPVPAPSPILLKQEVVAPPPPHRELPIIEGGVWTGEALRKVRESRGLSVREVCDRTKITRYHLENIEAERFTLLPAAVYLRGILVAVARELRLDGQKVARSYLERMAGAGTDPERSR
jgi:hypothetical protein